MEVRARAADDLFGGNDTCPYCGADIYIRYISDRGPEPKVLECPVCGKEGVLVVDYEPIFTLLRKDGSKDGDVQ